MAFSSVYWVGLNLNLIREGYDRLLKKCEELEFIVQKYNFLTPNLNNWEYTFLPQIVINGTSSWIYEVSDYDAQSSNYDHLQGSRFIVYLLRNGGSAENYVKAKYISPAYANEYVVLFESKGLHMSPFGDRSVLIIVEEYVIGCQSYRFIGCSLLYGFEDTAEFRRLGGNWEIHR